MVHKDFLSILKVLYSANLKYAKHSYVALQKNIGNENTPLLILGNGPSLKNEETKIANCRSRVRLLTLNQFYKAELFRQWKPDIHLLQANEYWADDVGIKYKKLQEETIESLSKVDWKLQLYLPQLAKNKRFVKRMSQNSNLIISYFNQVPVDGSPKLNHYLWNLGLATPRIHNTLVAALYLGIMLEFKCVFLFGTDHDWHKHISLDGNKLRNSYEHAYWRNNSSTLEKLNGNEFLLHEQFRKLYLTFKGYHDLKPFINKKGVQVINTNTQSFIDAFQKSAKWEIYAKV